MTQLLAAAGLAALLVPAALGWSLSFGDASGNRLAAGKGSFPRWTALSLPTEAPLRWLVALPPRRLAAVDASGTLWVFSVASGGLAVAARYGETGSADGPPVAVALGPDRKGVALVARDGRLLVWSDGALRSYDVGAPLAPLTFPAPVSLGIQGWDDLLAVAGDGAVLLIGGLPRAPRAISRVEARALPDARVTLADLDGDGAPEAVVLSDPTERYPHGILGDRVEATGVTVIGLSANGLSLRARYRLSVPAVFEDLVPLLAPIEAEGRPAILVARSSPEQGAAVVALGWKEGALVSVAESPPAGQPDRWTHLLGAADISGGGAPEVIAVRTPHIGGVLTAYRRRGPALVAVAQTAGYSSHAIGSRNQDQGLLADLDGNGRPEVVLPRQAREAIVGLDLSAGRFSERWSVALRSPLQSNLLAADLDGDGLLDLALADRGALRVFLSVR